MPYICPSYSKGPVEMKDREYLVFKYRSTPEAISKVVPEPLIPNNENIIYMYFISSKA